MRHELSFVRVILTDEDEEVEVENEWRYCFWIDDRICSSCRFLKEQRPPYCLTSSSCVVCIQSGLGMSPRCKIISYQVHVQSLSHLQITPPHLQPPLDAFAWRVENKCISWMCNIDNFSMQKRAKETRTKRISSVIIARAALEDYTSKQATRRTKCDPGKWLCELRIEERSDDESTFTRQVNILSGWWRYAIMDGWRC